MGFRRFTAPFCTKQSTSVYYMGQRLSRRHLNTTHSPLMRTFVDPLKLLAASPALGGTTGCIAAFSPAALAQMTGTSLGLALAVGGLMPLVSRNNTVTASGMVMLLEDCLCAWGTNTGILPMTKVMITMTTMQLQLLLLLTIQHPTHAQ